MSKCVSVCACVTLTAPAFALTTSVPAFWMRLVSESNSSVVKLTPGVVCKVWLNMTQFPTLEIGVYGYCVFSYYIPELVRGLELCEKTSNKNTPTLVKSQPTQDS